MALLGALPCPKSLQLFGIMLYSEHDLVRTVCNFSGSCSRLARLHHSRRGSGDRAVAADVADGLSAYRLYRTAFMVARALAQRTRARLHYHGGRAEQRGGGGGGGVDRLRHDRSEERLCRSACRRARALGVACRRPPP